MASSSGCPASRNWSRPTCKHWIGSERGFGDDVLRYSLCGFDVTGLEHMLIQVNRTLKRGKDL